MPRTISAASLLKINERLGIEPINIIKIQWVKDGGYHLYSDRTIVDANREIIVEGKLVSLDNLEAILDIANSGSSTSVSITLEDSSGEIKSIFDYHDIHSRPVQIYQWFSDIDIADMFLIFEGIISSPISWKEAARTISFDVLSKLEDAEVGFSVEDGEFDNVPESILGKAWPIVFGTVINMPVLQMDELPSGTLKTPIGIPDHNLSRQIKYFDDAATLQAGKATCLTSRAANMQTLAQVTGDPEWETKSDELYNQAYQIFNNINYNITPLLSRLKLIMGDQSKYDISIFEVINGHLFRQGIQVEIEINNAHYVGIFRGDTFHVSSRRSPDEPVHRTPGLNGVPLPSTNDFETVFQNTQQFTDSQRVQPTNINTFKDFGNDPLYANAVMPCEPPYFFQVGSLENKGDGYNNHQEKKNFFADAGSNVSVGGTYSVRYILSIIPGTLVLNLSARRTVGGLKILNPIPPQFYRIEEQTYGNLMVLVAIFDRPLSRLENYDWEDDVFATLQSPIGPNVIDIISWLINTYSNENSIDAASFDHVRALVDPYPANFALLEKKNIIDLLKEISWQSRCAIWLKDSIFYIKYLPEEGNSVDTLNDIEDIESEKLEVFTTDTEDLTTKFVATWKYDLSKTKDNQIILQYNVNKYGLHKDEFDFFIYNDAELVIKSATFWLIRKANIWKKIKCRTFLTKLRLETLDSVTISFSKPFVAEIDVLGVVEKASFDSDNFAIDMEIWLPVRLGEMRPYVFAYPADIDINLIFPTDEDIAGGFESSTPFDASGDLGGDHGSAGVNITLTPRRSGRGIRTTPSDQAPLPLSGNIITTTVPREYHSITQPDYDYRFNSVNEPNTSRPLPPVPKNSISGFVVSKNDDNTYVVDTYPYGKDKPGLRVHNVVILGVSEESVVEPDTPGTVLKVSESDGNGSNPRTRYYMVIPIWS